MDIKKTVIRVKVNKCLLFLAICVVFLATALNVSAYCDNTRCEVNGTSYYDVRTPNITSHSSGDGYSPVFVDNFSSDEDFILVGDTTEILVFDVNGTLRGTHVLSDTIGSGIAFDTTNDDLVFHDGSGMVYSYSWDGTSFTRLGNQSIANLYANSAISCFEGFCYFKSNTTAYRVNSSDVTDLQSFTLGFGNYSEDANQNVYHKPLVVKHYALDSGYKIVFWNTIKHGGKWHNLFFQVMDANDTFSNYGNWDVINFTNTGDGNYVQVLGDLVAYDIDSAFASGTVEMCGAVRYKNDTNGLEDHTMLYCTNGLNPSAGAKFSKDYRCGADNSGSNQHTYMTNPVMVDDDGSGLYEVCVGVTGDGGSAGSAGQCQAMTNGNFTFDCYNSAGSRTLRRGIVNSEVLTDYVDYHLLYGDFGGNGHLTSSEFVYDKMVFGYSASQVVMLYNLSEDTSVYAFHGNEADIMGVVTYASNNLDFYNTVTVATGSTDAIFHVEDELTGKQLSGVYYRMFNDVEDTLVSSGYSLSFANTTVSDLDDVAHYIELSKDGFTSSNTSFTPSVGDNYYVFYMNSSATVGNLSLSLINKNMDTLILSALTVNLTEVGNASNTNVTTTSSVGYLNYLNIVAGNYSIIINGSGVETYSAFQYVVGDTQHIAQIDVSTGDNAYIVGTVWLPYGGSDVCANETMGVQVTAEDPEQDSIWFGVICDYDNSRIVDWQYVKSNNASLSNDVVATLQCEYSVAGDYPLRIYVSDFDHWDAEDNFRSYNVNVMKCYALANDSVYMDYWLKSDNCTLTGNVTGQPCFEFQSDQCVVNGYKDDSFCPIWLFRDSLLGKVSDWIFGNIIYFVVFLLMVIVGLALYMRIGR